MEFIQSKPEFTIKTWKGHVIDLMAGPTVDQVDIEEIAHALAYQCRFTGHVNRFYSVAEHSIYVAKFALRMHGPYYLLHDVAEWIYYDLSKPLKNVLETKSKLYRELCDQCDKVVMKALGLNYTGFQNLYPNIKEVDNLVCDLEKKFLKGVSAPNPVFPEDHPLHGAPFGMEPMEAERTFLEYYQMLTA